MIGNRITKTVASKEGNRQPLCKHLANSFSIFIVTKHRRMLHWNDKVWLILDFALAPFATIIRRLCSWRSQCVHVMEYNKLLIIDTTSRRVCALPFQLFFNYWFTQKYFYDKPICWFQIFIQFIVKPFCGHKWKFIFHQINIERKCTCGWSLFILHQLRRKYKATTETDWMAFVVVKKHQNNHGPYKLVWPSVFILSQGLLSVFFVNVTVQRYYTDIPCDESSRNQYKSLKMAWYFLAAVKCLQLWTVQIVEISFCYGRFYSDNQHKCDIHKQKSIKRFEIFGCNFRTRTTSSYSWAFWIIHRIWREYE